MALQQNNMFVITNNVIQSLSIARWGVGWVGVSRVGGGFPL